MAYRLGPIEREGGPFRWLGLDLHAKFGQPIDWLDEARARALLEEAKLDLGELFCASLDLSAPVPFGPKTSAARSSHTVKALWHRAKWGDFPLTLNFAGYGSSQAVGWVADMEISGLRAGSLCRKVTDIGSDDPGRYPYVGPIA